MSRESHASHTCSDWASVNHESHLWAKHSPFVRVHSHECAARFPSVLVYGEYNENSLYKCTFKHVKVVKHTKKEWIIIGTSWIINFVSPWNRNIAADWTTDTDFSLNGDRHTHVSIYLRKIARNGGAAYSHVCIFAMFRMRIEYILV